MGQQVFTAIIHGKPVASANAHVVVKRGKHGSLKHSAEYDRWEAAAITQLTKHLVAAGHTPIRALVTSPSGKDAHKNTTRVTNPLFRHDDGLRYRIQVWFAAPEHLYARHASGPDKGEYKYRKDGQHWLETYKADTDGPLKGAKDVLAQAGVIDNDFYATISGPVYRVPIEEGREPFLVVEVSDASEPLPPHEGAFPPPPIWPTGDLSLYMPRVLSGSHEWYEDKKREAAFQAYLERHGKVAPVVISKIRCKRCHLLIGSGHVATEIWAHWGDEAWGESRWMDRVVLICDLCAAERFDEQDTNVTKEINADALRLLQESGATITDVPLPGERLFAEYIMARAFAEKQVRRRYRERYLLVASSEIATVDWTSGNPDNPGIEQRRSAKQAEIFGHDTAAKPHHHQPSPRPRVPGSNDRHRPSQVGRPVPQDLPRREPDGPTRSDAVYELARGLRTNSHRRHRAERTARGHDENLRLPTD